MKLNGKFAVQASMTGGKTLFEIMDGGKLNAVANYSNCDLGHALAGAAITAIATAGGSVFDRDAQQYVAGTLDQMVEA